MKVQSSVKSMPVRSPELFFGILMLIIIFLTSCQTTDASPKAHLTPMEIATSPATENPSEITIKAQSSYAVKEYHEASVPMLITMLMILCYGSLSAWLYLIKEEKK